MQVVERDLAEGSNDYHNEDNDYATNPTGRRFTATDLGIARCNIVSLGFSPGEISGHKHQISAGEVELYQSGDKLYLRVRSQTATLSHEEHKPVEIPRGDWMVRIQREYVPEEKRVSKRHDSEVSNVQHEWDDSDEMWDLVSD